MLGAPMRGRSPPCIPQLHQTGRKALCLEQAQTLDVKMRFIRRDVALTHVTNELSGLIGLTGNISQLIKN
jgi:hypothetical protein